MQLSTSDWVTIAATAVSVVSSSLVAIVVAIWQVKKGAAQSTVNDSPKSIAKSTRRWLMAQLWPFACSAAVALIVMSHALMQDGAVTKSFVISLVLGAFLLAFSILSAVGFIVAAAFRPAYLHLLSMTIRFSGPSSAAAEAKR